MKAREIKRKMSELNIRQMDLARKWRMRSSTINKLVNRQFTSERLEKRLAKALGITLEELRGQRQQEQQQGA